MTAVQIRRATVDDADTFSAIAQCAKAHWPYSAEQLAAWHSALQVSPEQILKSEAYLALIDEEDGAVIVGFYLCERLAEVWQLDHLWVLPAWMGQGIGRMLLEHARRHVASLGGDTIHIDADPNAESFYVRCGAQTVAYIEAPIPGAPTRCRPQMQLACATTA